MEGWKTVAVAVAGGAAGLVAEKSVTIPVSSGSTMIDQAIDIGLGVLGIYVAVKYIDHEFVGVAAAGAGAGWALGAALNVAGYVI